jgi:hypothetical protein
VGTTRPVVAREQPALVSLVMMRGSTASVEAVPRARRNSSRVYFRNCHSGTRGYTQATTNSRPMNMIAAAVAGGDQQCIGAQGIEPVLADDEGHGTECAHRRYPHDPAHDLEEQFQHRFHQGDHGEAAFAADDDDRCAEEDGEAQHLQEAVAGKGADHAGRDDAQKEGAASLGGAVNRFWR